MASIILGSQWGDEGKGKLTDHLLSTDAYDICARAAGGHNAGHSIKTGGQSFSFHLLPSGLVNPKTDNLIGSSVVFNLEAFFKELSELEAKGVPNVHERIHVSSRCHLNFALHAAVDGLSEVQLGNAMIGTTKRGIGPSYSTKASRDGLRVIDLYSDSFERKLRKLAGEYRQRYGDLLQYDVEAELRLYAESKDRLRPYIVDAVEYMRNAQETHKKVLVEGSQALMLDIDYGTYPYVTSSNTGLGGCIQGLTLNPTFIKDVIAVTKAYTTRVGGGPFPTEQLNEVGTKLQDIGGEIGVSTGRRRRCGWLDLVVLKYSTAVNHYTMINLTKLDVLDTFPIIRVATAYITPEGEKVTTFPADLNELEKYTVEYVDFEGWQTSTKGLRSWDELPSKAKKYIALIESFIGVKVVYVGTGQDREDMIIRS
ncbi:adenylosuccinate synthetase [Grosmannia clavigera kw1407]|uniref:Adenylosuccinate synthetase n=1 Tax=Grosmannia clavigera (strain kw1407 / UAMH 11150) TaxID=655863 RepID=F0XPH4_GROCL|nr:adenylosuccinate synthetase [Grosmannia clavigera kw1407]EFX00192.1 adenylosuccinate synthetase [Grosmannia clavigera kw1407]